MKALVALIILTLATTFTIRELEAATLFGTVIGQSAQYTIEASTDGLTLIGLTEVGNSNSFDPIGGLAFDVVVPIPAALPLFGTGLGLLGSLELRRQRKAV